MSSITMEKPVTRVETRGFKFQWRDFRSLFALAIVIVVLTFLTDGTFFTPRNITNLTRQVALNGILAVGMTFVILIGGIDLSVGSVVALSGVVAGYLQVSLGVAQWTGSQAYLATFLSILSAMTVGLLCGMFNGWLITKHRIAPFIITLGMMVIARGLALIFAKGAAIAPLSENFDFLGQGYLPPMLSVAVVTSIGLGTVLFSIAVGKKTASTSLAVLACVVLTGFSVWTFQGYRGMPIPVLIFGILGNVGALVLQKTRLGRFIMAIGGNPDAAWLAGVPMRKITFGIYAAMGVLAGLCGAILSARLNGALPTAGELFELDAIAAVVIGGTSLVGGMGTVRGSILGAFFMGALNNGMSLLDITEFYQKVIKGVIIILAVWFDMQSQEKE